MLGDKQFNFFVASISQYRTMSLSYVNLSRRFQYALQGYSQTQFFYGQLGGVFYDPSYAPFIEPRRLRLRRARCAAAARSASTRSTATAASRSRAASCSSTSSTTTRRCRTTRQQYQLQTYGQPLFRNGMLMPLGVAFIQETTVFREFGPLAGSTMRLAYDVSPKIGGTLSRQTLRRATSATTCGSAASGLLATRIRGFKSTGDFPDFHYFGGNSELRGYDYLQFVGQNTSSPTPSCASR